MGHIRLGELPKTKVGSGDEGRAALSKLQDDIGQLHVVLDALDASDVGD